MKKRRMKLRICNDNNMMRMYEIFHSETFINLRQSYEDIDKYLNLYKHFPERVNKLIECRRKLHYYGDQFKYKYRTISKCGEFEDKVIDMYWKIQRLVYNWEKEDNAN